MPTARQTNDANASYLPRLDDKPATFHLIGDRATIRVTNPHGGQQTDVHIVANPGAIAIGLSSTDHTSPGQPSLHRGQSRPMPQTTPYPVRYLILDLTSTAQWNGIRCPRTSMPASP